MVRLVGAVAIAGAAIVVCTRFDVDRTIAALVLLAAVIAATLLGRAAGAVAAIVAFLGFNYFFTPPLHSLAIQDRDDVIALLVFAAAAMVLGSIVARLNDLRIDAERRAGESRVRLDLTTRLLAGDDPNEVARAAARALVGLFDLTRCTVRSHDLDLHVSEPTDAPSAGPGTEFSVADVTVEFARRTPLSDDDRALLEALVAGLAASLDRIRLEQVARDARVAAELNRTRSGFLSAVTHNLRTPLAAMHAAAATLLDRSIDLPAAERRELIETISEETVRMEHLVTNVLELSRIRAGGVEPEPVPVSLTDLAQTAVRRLAPLTTEHTLSLTVEDDLPDVLVDVSLIEQVLLNLLENALRYAPAGTPIEIVGGRSDEVGFAALSVVDHGPGVAPEDRARVFEEFVRLDERPDSTGTGLGLAIAAALVRAHGGKLSCEATPGGGASFVCTLPLEVNA